MLQKANIDISDVDSDIGRRDKKSASGGSRRTADGGKRPRKSRGSSSGSNSSSEERRKRHKVVGASSATASSSASASGRRLVKPHRKKAKKLAAGNDEAVSNAMLWEETSLSSEGGGEGERSLRVAKGKHKRVSEKPRTNNSSKAHSIIPRKKKQGSGPAPPRQQQGKRAKLARQRSQDAVGRPGSRDGWPTPAAGSDGRGPPQLARGGSLGTATRSLSLSQYRVRKGATGLLLSSSPRTLGKSVTGLKAAVAGQNIGEGHAQQISKTPTVESSTDIGVNRGISNHTPAMPVPAPSNKLNDKYEKVDHFNGVRRKKSNGKYFVWAESGPLDGRPYDT